MLPAGWDCWIYFEKKIELKCLGNLKVQEVWGIGTCDVNQDENFPDPDLNCEEFDYDNYDCSQ